jgi:PAS domain S-box-containing protein
VLLVDDDDSVRLTLEAVLTQKGYQVQPAATLTEGRRRLESGRFDVIIADLQLDQGHSGVDMLVEALARDPDVVTIVLTAYVSTAAAVEALRSGATNFLAKPCNIDELVEAIQHGLEKRNLLRELRQAREEAAARRESERSRTQIEELYAQLQEAHQASEVLAAVGKELASSLGLDDLLERLVRSVVPVFAGWAVVHVVEAGLRHRVAVAHRDPQKETLARDIQRLAQPIESEASPLRSVLDSGEPRYIPEYTFENIPADGADPEFVEIARQLNGRSLISVVLDGRRARIGAMSFVQSDSDRRFTPADVALAQEIGNRAALAIENAQLYRDTQRAARELAEVEEHQRFLAEASKILDSSLEYQLTLDRLAHLAVPKLADWCVVHVLQHEQLGPPLAIAASDPAKAAQARSFEDRWAAHLDDPQGVGRVIRTGEPQLVSEITDEMLRAGAVDAEHLAILRAMGPWTSGMVVPLTARGQTLGAMTLISAESGRTYGQDDLLFALDVAGRAATAVDNAHLYAAEQRARVEAERLQSLAQQLGRTLSPDEVLQEVADTAAELLRAPVAGVFLLDAAQQSFDLVAGRGFALGGGAKVRLPRDQSVAGQVLETGTAAIIPDARQAPVSALPPLVAGEAVGALVVAPILSRSECLGVIEVYSTATGVFVQRDADLLLTLAATAATAIENARTYANEQRARREAERLQVLTEKLAQSITAEDVLDQVANTAAELLEAPVAGVFLLNETAESFDLAAGCGLDIASGVSLPRGRSLAGSVITSREPVAIADVRTAATTALPRLVSGEAIGSLVVAPVLSRSGPLGVIEVYSPSLNAFRDRDAILLSALAAAAATALQNARLYRERELDLARLNAIVEQLPVGIVVIEAGSRAVSLKNREADRVYGGALEGLRAGVQDNRVGFRPSGRQYTPDEWPLARALSNGEVITSERIEVQRPDGGRSILSINAAPLRDPSGAIVAAVAVFDDVSGEEELRRQKEQFLAAAAHDLKTPITSIRGLVQLLQRQLGRLDLPQPIRTRETLEKH